MLEQLNVASLSRPTVFLQFYPLLLLHFGQIINDDDDDDDADDDISSSTHRPLLQVPQTRTAYPRGSRAFSVAVPNVINGINYPPMFSL